MEIYYLDDETIEALPEPVRLHIRSLYQQRVMLINQVDQLMRDVRAMQQEYHNAKP